MLLKLLKSHFIIEYEMIRLFHGDTKASLAQIGFAQQSVHLTLGILRTSQAVFCTLSFFWLDGFAVPHPSAGNANRWQELALNL